MENTFDFANYYGNRPKPEPMSLEVCVSMPTDTSVAKTFTIKLSTVSIAGRISEFLKQNRTPSEFMVGANLRKAQLLCTHTKNGIIEALYKFVD